MDRSRPSGTSSYETPASASTLRASVEPLVCKPLDARPSTASPGRTLSPRSTSLRSHAPTHTPTISNSPWPSTTPFLALLHAEGLGHLRREVGVMVHYLPSVRFATVDIRHAPVDAYRLVSYSRLAMLGAQGVGGILAYGNHDHVIHSHLPTGERLGGLLPGVPNLLPSDPRTG